MRFRITGVVLVFMLFLTAGLLAQERFDRSATIPADTLDVGGFGNIVSGVDFDNDGRPEIYAVNNDWNDVMNYDLVPRIYKYEKDDAGNWQVVWSTRLSIDFQNTWPALAAADLDKDGKQEIVWGPVNNFGGGLQPNPERIVVFETPGDGSDNMGVQDPATGDWLPNASWTITDADNENLRPFRWLINDIDSDGTDEIVAACRAGNGIQIYSVDNIPDNADGSETWTTKFSGVTGTFYDLAILNAVVYGIRDNGDVWAVKYDAVGDSFAVSGPQVGLAGAGSWGSAQTVDVDGNGEDEIILASWGSTDNNVYLLQESGDTLKATMIQDVPDDSYRSYGGAVGDLDNDGLLDYVFGTRQSTPNGIIDRLEYQGGDIADPANWVINVIDYGISDAAQYDIISISNLDDDPEDEVVYTGTPRYSTQGPQPIVVLDNIPVNQPVITAVADVPNDQGRQVWVVWMASEDDVPAPPLTSTNVPVAIINGNAADFPGLQINGKTLVPTVINQNSLQKAAAVPIEKYAVWRIDNELPVQVASTQPLQAAYYAAVVPTLGDGAEWAGNFVVSAHSPDVAVNWQSFVKTGMSEDNLIPTAPGNLSAQMVDMQLELMWDESPDPDFNYFSVRRGTESGFDAADPAAEIGTTTDINFMDADVEPGVQYFYRVVAFDFTGNQGDLSEEVSGTVVGISDKESGLPKSFALRQNYPNPFNPETRISFDLPRNSDVSIVIYNTLGQIVRTLVNDSRNAGTYTVTWNGRNDHGALVANGLYIYMLKAGNYTQVRKMTFLK
ncbi:MAG: FG-GAP-like repeat-containing protein [Calditrichia bacterium]